MHSWRQTLRSLSFEIPGGNPSVSPVIGDVVKVIAGPAWLQSIGLGSKPFKEKGVIIEIDEHTGSGWIMVKFPHEGKLNFPLQNWNKYLRIM